jgi:hypothetical protein
MTLWTTFVAAWPGLHRPGQQATRYRTVPKIEALEDRCLLASTITSVFGAGAGGGPEVTVRFDDGSRLSFLAFDPAFLGGVSVALGRVNGSPIPDVIVGASAGGGPEVKVFDGAQLVAGHVVPTAAFFAFPAAFSGGVTLAAGPVNGTGHADVVVGAGPGGAPGVVVFDGAQLAQGQAVATASFIAFPAEFPGGVKVAVGRVNGTTHDDVIAAAGPGGGPEVAVFDGAELAQGQAVATAAFMAFTADFAGGTSIAVGPVNGTGHADVVVGAGPGGGPEVEVFGGAQLAQGVAVPTAAFMAFPAAFPGGVSVAVGHVNGTGNDDVVVGAGPGGGPEVEVFGGAQLAQGAAVPTAAFFPFPLGFAGGVQVAVAAVPGSVHEDVLALAGPGGGPEVVVYSGALLAVGNTTPVDAFFAFAPGFRGGINQGFSVKDFRPRPIISFIPPSPPPGGGGGGTTTGFVGTTPGFGGTTSSFGGTTPGFGGGTSGGSGGGTTGGGGTFGGGGTCC